MRETEPPSVHPVVLDEGYVPILLNKGEPDVSKKR